MKIRDWVVRGGLTALCVAALASPALAADPLRVCADPDNLPFSKSEGPERGIYVELAELVAQKLNATPVQYTWWLTYNQRKALRLTAGECDAVFALPTDADYRARGLQKTAAFLEESYALVSAPGFVFNGLADLKGKRLGVQYMSNPHILLSQRNDLPFSTFKTSDEVFAALAKGEIEAGFLWGPVAGYENLRRYAGRWQVTPLAGPNLTGQVSVAVLRSKPELVKGIDDALTALKPEIAALALKYGFPAGKPVSLVIAGNTLPPASPAGAMFANHVPAHLMVPTQATPNEAGGTPAKAPSKPKPKTTTTPDKTAKAAKSAGGAGAVQTAAVTEPALSPTAQLGRVRFNDQCSHCHGSDGASPIRERDVRRLKMRYDAKWKDVAQTTIKNGRPDLGMPTWKEILKEPEIEQLLSFLETLQK